VGCSVLTSFDGFGGGSADGGGAQGGDDGGGNSANFCLTHAAQATFCADFDETSPTTGWLNGVQQANVTQNNYANLSSAVAVSPPASLQAVPGGPAMFSDVELDLTTGVAYSHVHVELEVYPDSAAPMPVVEIDFCNQSCGNTPPYDFEILINQGGFVCVGEHGNGCTASLMQQGGPPLNAWTHLTLEADLTTGAITLKVGNNSPIQGMLTIPAPLPTALFVFDVGLPSTTAGELHADNVLLTVH
jgi:hypothetical protein